MLVINFGTKRKPKCSSVNNKAIFEWCFCMGTLQNIHIFITKGKLLQQLYQKKVLHFGSVILHPSRLAKVAHFTNSVYLIGLHGVQFYL